MIGDGWVICSLVPSRSADFTNEKRTDKTGLGMTSLVWDVIRSPRMVLQGVQGAPAPSLPNSYLSPTTNTPWYLYDSSIVSARERESLGQWNSRQSPLPNHIQYSRQNVVFSHRCRISSFMTFYDVRVSHNKITYPFFRINRHIITANIGNKTIIDAL